MIRNADRQAVTSPTVKTVRAGSAWFIGAVVGATLSFVGMPQANSSDFSTRPATRERTRFTNAEIADGFFKIAFGAEFGVAGKSDRVRKFDGPVRVLDNRANANRRADLAGVIADIRSHVRNLDIAMTEDRAAANVVVTLVRDRNELRRTMRAFYGKERASEIDRRLTPQCLSGFSEDAEHRIRRSEVWPTPRTAAISASLTVLMRSCCRHSVRSMTHLSAVDHVQRRRTDGVFRRLRPIYS